MVNLSHSIEETESIASFFIFNLLKKAESRHATVIGLYGDLGSGKTAFTKGVAKALRIQENVTSPTFVLEKIYRLDNHEKWDNMIHIDAYRLNKGEELIALGWNEIIKDPHNLILVEWPENVADVMPEYHLSIKFSFVDPNTRGIDIEG